MASERNKGIGQRIRERREELGFTQDELASAITSTSVTGNVISRWERGQNRPSGDYQEELARALGVSAAYLLFGRESDVGVPAPDLTATLERIEQRLAALEALPEIAGLLGDLVTALGQAPSRGAQIQEAVAETIAQLGGDPGRSRTGDASPKPARRARSAREKR